MPTTTNYGWTTPADTDLVKDGASAIRTLGTAIDTTVFNNASAAIAKTIVDAKGDIIAATAADTVARLAVGANDTVLTADSSTATGLKWATPASGGMTLLSTTTLSSTSTTVSGISGSYTNLLVIVQGAVFGTGSSRVQILPNGSTTLAYGIVNKNDAGAVATNLISSSVIGAYSNTLNTGGLNVITLLISNYANTSYYKSFNASGYTLQTGSTDVGWHSGGGLKTTSAITSITVNNDNNYTFSAGQILIYGVK